MKKIYLLIFIFIVIAGCNNNKTNNEIVEEKPQNLKEEKKDTNSENEIREFLCKPVNEKITLLSFKYEISDTITRKIILEYIKENEPFNYSILIYGMDSIGKNYNQPEKKLADIFNKIATENSLSLKIVANIIYDYKLLSSLESLESSVDNIESTSEKY